MTLLENVQNLLADKHLRKLETVQTLWSGYGEIARYFSPKLNTNVIVKYINPPTKMNHPRGWNSQTSHQRKLKSYRVEASFYQHYAKQCDDSCKVPSLIASSFEQNNTQLRKLMVLQDVDQIGFSQRKTELNLNEVKSVIKWLAFFHGKFLNITADDLWPVGTYWHLATRQDELAAMADGVLKAEASRIDATLNKGLYQTLVHGDAKLANFCFADESIRSPIAAVDFQYVGKGVGVKDLAYFLGSCLSAKDLAHNASILVDEYFSQLEQAMSEYQVVLDFAKLEAEWRYLYAFAWADFQRFLLGWSPSHSKINCYMQQQTQLALSQC